MYCIKWRIHWRWLKFKHVRINTQCFINKFRVFWGAPSYWNLEKTMNVLYRKTYKHKKYYVTHQRFVWPSYNWLMTFLKFHDLLLIFVFFFMFMKYHELKSTAILRLNGWEGWTVSKKFISQLIAHICLVYTSIRHLPRLWKHGGLVHCIQMGNQKNKNRFDF